MHYRTIYASENIMKTLTHLMLLAGLLSAPLAAVAAESPHSLSANVSLTSNYIFRGISQTSGDPAIQGGFDYAHSSGFYLGTWASNVSWIEDFQGYQNGSMEIDLYAGFGGDIGSSGLTYDVGAIQYFYPGEKAGVTTGDTTELYGALGWKWFTLKYSYALSNEVFGFPNADGSDYLDISASYPVGDTGLTLGAHWGTFSFDNNSAQDYEDWKVSVEYDMGKLSSATSGMTVGLAYTDTNAKKANWSNAVAQGGNYLGKGAVSVWVSKSF